MKRTILPAILAALTSAGFAQVPEQINYQGRVSVQGVNFTGTGQFKFALVGAAVNLNRTATAGSMAGSSVTFIFVQDGGAGYTTPPAVTIAPPVGVGTTATAESLLGAGGMVTGFNITSGGSGYAEQPVVTIAPPPSNIVAETFWSNDLTSVAGNEPTAAVALPVSNGLYSLALGNTSLANMAMLPGNQFENRPDVRLRVWFNDGTHGFQLLTPDQRLLAAPYAMSAGIASTAYTVPDGAITQDKLADGAVNTAKLAPGAVSTDRLNVTGTASVGNVLSFGPGGVLTWTPGGTSWALGGNAGTDTNSFLGTLDNLPLAFRINNEEVLRLDTNTDLVMPALPEITGATGMNGIGSYVFNSGLFGTTFGRTFGGADIDGPVLYGQKGGGLGIKKQSVGDLGFTEKTILNWRENIINVYSTTGFSIAPGDTPMITRAYDPFLVATGSKYHGHGRWGLFMEAGQLNLGIPSNDAGSRGFYVSRYDVNGARWNLCGIDNDTGKFSVNGLGQELAYLGGDGNGDVEFGSLNPTVENLTFWNPASGQRLNIHARDAHVRQLTIYGGADLAEPFAMSHEDVEPGSVVVIDTLNPGKLRKSQEAYDKKVAGIVSGADGIRPGISMIQEDMLEAGKNVALSGRVYVKANTSAGDIQPGDLLTTSAIPGEAMKASDHGQAQGAILGKAMTSLSGDSGKVLVLVTLQ